MKQKKKLDLNGGFSEKMADSHFQIVDFPHQCQLNLGRESLLVVSSLDKDDDGRGHDFGQLVRSYRVVLQREVGEGHEAAKAERQPHYLAQRDALRREDFHSLAYVESQPRDDEMHEGEGHVGETVVDVDPLVDEDDADGGEQVDQEAGNDAPAG